MPEPLAYFVYNSRSREWLAGDHKWSPLLSDAVEFLTVDEANSHMESEGGDYVFACMPSA